MMTMAGKICLITGGTNGIGKSTAQALAQMGATVVIGGRNAPKTAQAVAAIRAASGTNNVHALLADLSSQQEVRRLADAFTSTYPHLHVLINNAGAAFLHRQLSVDGYEMTFAFNHLAYFLLTNLLLDTLKASAPARIINVSSDAHTGGKVNFDDLNAKNSWGMAGMSAYSNSKLENIMFTYELARRLEGTGVTANVLHPGLVNTGFNKNNGGLMRIAMRLISPFSLTPEQGADTIIYLASSPEVEGVSGKYWDKRKAVKSIDASYDISAQQRLWAVSADMTGIKAKVGV